MDPRFPFWMHLQLQSQGSINKIISTMTVFFRTGACVADFDNDETLETLMLAHARRNAKLAVFLEAEAPDPDPNPTKKHGSDATTTHQIECLGWYATFLGRRVGMHTELIKKLAYITKFIQQSNVSIHIQDNTPSRLLLTSIVDGLRRRQPSMNQRILRWLTLGHLAESSKSLQRFGTHELQPFLELSLRYTLVPMSSTRIKRMRMTLQQLPTDLDSLYGTAARAVMFAPTKAGTRVNDVLFMDGDRGVTLVSMVYANGSKDTEGMLVARPCGQTLSVYLYWFFRHCKGNMNTAVHRRHQVGESYPLFSQGYGGEWKHLVDHVRDYATQLELDVGAMGLASPSSAYIYKSKLTWVAARAGPDASRIADDARLVGLGFANDNMYYTGLASLRYTHRARARVLGEVTTPASVYTVPQLDPLPVELYAALFLQMTGQWGVDTLFHPRALTMDEHALGPWTPVVENPELFSTEATENFGQGRFDGLPEHFKDKQKQNRRKTLPPPRPRSTRRL